MWSHLTLIECLSGDTSDRNFSYTTVSLYTQLHRSARLPAHHLYHLLIGLTHHCRTIYRDHFISLLEACLLCWALGMHLGYIQRSRIADTFRPDVKRYADDTLR